ncbi:response regulator [Paucibacter sp. B2R-40]|uniref:HD domain-containing phosphohydrolase n=1 Tax=Paucibacter sp. B2R-40 TaxID=2893554 RepID=UPI0021E4F216|nr:HD domain-containing phosphohydrolase [Paucibacter sp. B2R-40]MCV2352928.1 response regulator [Paucibacter sp. B2R-40]
MSNSPLLIVDDDPSNLAVLRQILSPLYPLVFARSGLDAIAAAHKHAPALVLLDVQMPGMDGYSVCRQLKADAATHAIPVIFVTSLSEVGDEARGFAAGAVDYIIKPVSAPIVLARVKAHLSLVGVAQLEQVYHDAIYMLAAAAHLKDKDTGAHIWRMGAYAGAIASACGWSRADRRLLELAAPMHDTGKIGIPETILCKPGRLDTAEFALMQTHAQIGFEVLCMSQAPVFKMAAEIALCHHEKWDGSGYPNGLTGQAIPESARITAIADVFDALGMRRPYKDAWPMEQVLATMLAGAGTHFEPRLIEVFMSILPQIQVIKNEWDEREATGPLTMPAEL